MIENTTKVKTLELQPASGGSKRSGGERSEPERSFEPPATSAARPGALDSDPEVLERPLRRRFTADYKTRIVREAAACTQPGQIGALLRREGLYSSHLNKWRQQFALGGRSALADNRRGRKPNRPPLAAENEQLRRKNARLERRLKQAEAIIEFQKKVSEMLALPLTGVDENDGDA